MNFLIIVLLVVLVIAIGGTIIRSLVEFFLDILGWLVVIGLILAGVIMFKFGAGWIAAVPIGLGFILLTRGGDD